MNASLLLADATVAARHDPTWIYSTLAQTAGALVGLLGAVLVSRVVTLMASLKPDIDDIEVRIHNTIIQLRGTAAGVLPRKTDAAFGPEGMAWYGQLAPIYQKLPPTGEVTEKELEEFAEALRASIKAYPAVESQTQTMQANDIRGTIQRDIDMLTITLGSKLAEFRRQSFPWSLWFIFLLLAFLSFVGVVWPLTALAMLTEEYLVQMQAMLWSFAVGVLALVGYFLYLFWELHQLRRFYWTLNV